MADAKLDIGVNVGEVIADKYRVEEIIGIGGMGAVVAARHLELGARVAIKVLLPQSRDAESIRRFSAEARAMFNLKSEHVAKVQDVGKLANGAPFMVMEYLVGTDLGTFLAQNGALAPIDAVHFVLQACEAVAEAHSLGIVHRDIKPQNLFLARRVDGSACIKVLDFGISRVPGQPGEQTRITHSSAVMGTPLYMSPEQLHSTTSADSRSDIWALGVVLYELLTRKVPFEAPSAPALYALLLHSTAVSPSAIDPRIPEELSLVVMKCLERDRDRRYASVAELAKLLEPFAPESMSGAGTRLEAVHQQTVERALPAALDPTVAVSPLATQANWEGTTKRRRKTAVAAIIGAMMGVALFIGVIVLNHEKPSASALHETSPGSSTPLIVPSGAIETPPASTASTSAASFVDASAPLAAPSALPSSPARPRGNPPRKPPTRPASSGSLLEQRTW
jgi:serine/threonine-protein kinase